MGIELNKEFSTEEYWMVEKHLKKCSTSIILMEIQVETTQRFYLTPVRMSKIKIKRTADAGEDVEKEGPSSIAGGIENW